MKTYKLLGLFIVITSVIFFSGCMNSQTVRTNNQVFEDVFVTKGGKLLGASRDNINITNICPSGYFVDFKKNSRILFEGIIPGQTVTVHPSSSYRDEPVAFSTMVYTKKNGEKVLVSFYDQIISIGGIPVTVAWDVKKDYSSVNLQRTYYDQGYGIY